MRYVSAGRVYRISAPIMRDLNTIKDNVEKELKTPIISTCRQREYIDAKKLFIALVLYVYNNVQRELKSPNTVTLAALGAFLKYKSHASISLHLHDSHKGNRSLLDFIQQDERLWTIYIRLKLEINTSHKLPFRKFLEDKRNDLKHEIAIINRYLNLKYGKKKKKKAIIKISIKGIEDIIIEKKIKEYDELKEGNDEIYLIQQMYGRNTSK